MNKWMAVVVESVVCLDHLKVRGLPANAPHPHQSDHRRLTLAHTMPLAMMGSLKMTVIAMPMARWLQHHPLHHHHAERQWP
jgi:hypothetical protein